jgi:hypothetical protein
MCLYVLRCRTHNVYRYEEMQQGRQYNIHKCENPRGIRGKIELSVYFRLVGSACTVYLLFIYKLITDTMYTL